MGRGRQGELQCAGVIDNVFLLGAPVPADPERWEAIREAASAPDTAPYPFVR